MRASAGRPRVLLVDDDLDSLDALETLLDPLGAQLFKATSGEQALRTLAAHGEFALILMDVRMAGMSGYETAARIRQDEHARTIPIIFLTSFARDEEELKAGYAHGAVDYLQKPFPVSVLLGKVSSFIELFRARERAPPSLERGRLAAAAAREGLSAVPPPRLQPPSPVHRSGAVSDQILRGLYEESLPRYGGGAVSLYLLDEPSRQLDLVQAIGYSDEVMSKWRHVSMAWRLPLTDAVREAQPQWLPSRQDWVEPASAPSALNPVQAISVPLLTNGKVLGVLGISLHPKQELGEDEQAFFTAIAHSCAQAIAQEWQEEDLLERQRTQSARPRLGVLADVSQSLRTAGQDSSSLFNAIPSEVVRHLADGSALRLLSDSGQRLECVSLRHVNLKAQEELARVLSTPVELPSEPHLHTARTGEPLFMPTVSQEELLARILPSHRPAVERYPIHSWMLVPLRAHGRIIGTLEAVRHTPRRPFTQEDFQLLEEFAGIAALTIEEARLLQQQEFQQRLRHQLEYEQKLIGIVSHDLRTPLGAITTAAGLLDATPGLDERQRRAVHRILSSSERAARLIRDFLDFTQAHLGGGIPLTRQPMDLHAVVRETVGEVLHAFPERPVRVEAQGAGRGQWDPDRLSQVITNLVGNALAYSERGTPVEVKCSEEPGSVLLEVHNQGPPISPELIPRLFEPLTRGAQTAQPLGRHIGLGLYIVREIVQGHGGTIEVSSSPETGTTFTVRLPRS